MGNRRTFIAGAAILLAVLAGLLVYFYASAADTRAADDVALVEAFIASGEIPKGTTGAQAIQDGLIQPARVLRGSVPPAAVLDSGDLEGKVAAATIDTGQFITAASFVAPADGGGGTLASSIAAPDLVAVTVAVDAERGVANQIAPGDRVDVAVVDEAGAGAEYILTDVKVLAVGQETSASATGPEGEASLTASSTGLITFELTAADALRVVAANRSGSLYLTLRSIATGGPDVAATVPAGGRQG